MKIILKQDSRDQHVKQYFGTPTVVPDEFELDKGITNPIERPGQVDCTAISACDVATNQTGTAYNADDLWSLTPQTAQGADPRDSMQALIDKGLEPLNGGPRDTRWNAYLRSDGTSGDYFATTQASMIATNSPTTIASNWYSNWDVIGPEGIMPSGDTRVSGHDWEVTGWKIINGEPHFHVKSWLGYFMWMPKSVFNEEMDKWGTAGYIPTTQTILINYKKNILQTLIDLYANLVLLLQRKILSLNASGFPPILYTVAKNALGTKQTLDPSVPSDVGCSEAISAMLKTAGIVVPQAGIAGTAQLYTWLKNNARFSQIAAPQAGDIIISPTTSLGKIDHGHVGIMAMYNVQYINDYGIISNDSDTGLVREKWCLKDWIAYYQIYGGLDVAYFRLVS